MIQQYHFLVYTQNNWKQGLEERYLLTHVQSSIIHNSQKGETTQDAHWQING